MNKLVNKHKYNTVIRFEDGGRFIKKFADPDGALWQSGIAYDPKLTRNLYASKIALMLWKDPTGELAKRLGYSKLGNLYATEDFVSKHKDLYKNYNTWKQNGLKVINDQDNRTKAINNFAYKNGYSQQGDSYVKGGKSYSADDIYSMSLGNSPVNSSPATPVEKNRFMAALLYDANKNPMTYDEYLKAYTEKFQNNTDYANTVGAWGSTNSQKNFSDNWNKYKEFASKNYTLGADGKWTKNAVAPAKSSINWTDRAKAMFGQNDLNGDNKVDEEDARWLQNQYNTNKDAWKAAGYLEMANGNYAADALAGKTTLHLFNWYQANKDKLNTLANPSNALIDVLNTGGLNAGLTGDAAPLRSLYYDLNRDRLTNNYLNTDWLKTNATNLNTSFGSSNNNVDSWKMNYLGLDTDVISAIQNMYGDSYRGRRFAKRFEQGNIKAKDLRRLGESLAKWQRQLNLSKLQPNSGNLEADSSTPIKVDNTASTSGNAPTLASLNLTTSLYGGPMNGFGKTTLGNFNISKPTFNTTTLNTGTTNTENTTTNIPVTKATDLEKATLTHGYTNATTGQTFNERLGIWE